MGGPAHGGAVPLQPRNAETVARLKACAQARFHKLTHASRWLKRRSSLGKFKDELGSYLRYSGDTMRMAKDDTKTLSCLRSSAKESFMSRIAAFFKRGKKEECHWNWRRFFAILRDAKEFEEEMTMYRKRHRTQKAKKAFT